VLGIVMLVDRATCRGGGRLGKAEAGYCQLCIALYLYWWIHFWSDKGVMVGSAEYLCCAVLEYSRVWCSVIG